MRFYRPVFITSSPNTSIRDVLIGMSLFVRPWKWKSRSLVNTFQQDLKNYLNTDSELFLLDSGRSSLYFILKYLNIGVGDEVIAPAFTCLAVANPIHWSGAKPVYVDIESESFNMNLSLLESKITDNTKAIIAQHTFGNPVDLNKLKEIIGDRNILIIEDIAHALGGEVNGSKLGTLGDAAVLGFGIDKAISGVRGGGALMNINSLEKKGFKLENLKVEYENLPEHPLGLALKSALNPLIWHIATPLYFIGYKNYTLGRFIIRFLFRLGIIGNVVNSDENVGEKPNWMPAKTSPILARLANFQLSNLDNMNSHRISIAKLYSQSLGVNFNDHNNVYQKFSFLTSNNEKRKELYEIAKSNWFIIGDWLPRPLYSKFSSTEVYKVLSYIPDDYPVAEDVASRIVNLPTSININMRKATLLSNLIKEDDS